jgi:midasin (ATPase involved in ribosome maturation)
VDFHVFIPKGSADLLGNVQKKRVDISAGTVSKVPYVRIYLKKGKLSIFMRLLPVVTGIFEQTSTEFKTCKKINKYTSLAQNSFLLSLPLKNEIISLHSLHPLNND